jgi:hypothetical protein
MSLLNDFSHANELTGAESIDFASFMQHKGMLDVDLEQMTTMLKKWQKSKKKGQFNRILHEKRRKTFGPGKNWGNQSMRTTPFPKDPWR